MSSMRDSNVIKEKAVRLVLVIVEVDCVILSFLYINTLLEEWNYGFENDTQGECCQSLTEGEKCYEILF